MNLCVVTISARDAADPYAQKSAAAVRATLPLGADFLVVPSHGGPRHWTEMLWTVCKPLDAVAIVDDDDLVLPGALQACADALTNTSAGLAFTDEDIIDAEDRVVALGHRGVRRRMDLAMHPRCVHHLAVFKPSFVPEETINVARDCGIGLDWLMRAAAGLLGGAVHVPMVGYQWRRHANQDSSARATQYMDAMPSLRALTRSWMGCDTAIPQVA